MRFEREEKADEPVKGFDLRVTHRDETTGLVVREDPYVLRVIGNAEDPKDESRQRLWERPAGSGNLWDKSNNAIGRWISEEKIIKGKKCKVGHYDPDAPHIAWAPPLTEDQKIAQENAALKAEIAALKAEQMKKDTSMSASASAPKKKDQGA